MGSLVVKIVREESTLAPGEVHVSTVQVESIPRSIKLPHARSAQLESTCTLGRLAPTQRRGASLVPLAVRVQQVPPPVICANPSMAGMAVLVHFARKARTVGVAIVLLRAHRVLPGKQHPPQVLPTVPSAEDVALGNMVLVRAAPTAGLESFLVQPPTVLARAVPLAVSLQGMPGRLAKHVIPGKPMVPGGSPPVALVRMASTNLIRVAQGAKIAPAVPRAVLGGRPLAQTVSPANSPTLASLLASPAHQAL